MASSLVLTRQCSVNRGPKTFMGLHELHCAIPAIEYRTYAIKFTLCCHLVNQKIVFVLDEESPHSFQGEVSDSEGGVRAGSCETGRARLMCHCGARVLWRGNLLSYEPQVQEPLQLGSPVSALLGTRHLESSGVKEMMLWGR